MDNVKEEKIQKWLEKKYSNIKSLINNVDQFEDLNTDQIPYYSLDYLIKKKVAESSKYVYDLLDEVDLITANKNISLDKMERLFPDLVLFSPDYSTFFIIEIKREKQAEREAITELLAYEHELKNLFPFMSNIEVCFILIASDYNTLLSHSVYSLSLWQNKKILPLKINGIENEDENEWTLSLYLPTSWTLLSLDSFKSEHIYSTNLVLEDKDAYNRDVDIKNKTDNFDILMRGMELIVKEAERNNVSGFVLLSRLTSSDLANWCFTICVVNPFSFYNNLDYPSKIKDSFNTKYNSDDLFPKCTTEITSKSKQYLKIFFRPYFENFTDWKSQKKNLKNISEPISIDFFGQIDDIVNNFVINKEVRDYYYPEINNENLDWKNARIGLNIIDNILYDNVFIEGNFDYYGFYKFGTYIGTLNQYFNILKYNIEFFENEHFLGKLQWIEIEFINVYRELFLFKRDENYPIYKSISKDKIDLSIENLNLIIDYMLKTFIDIDILKQAFTLGLEIKNYYIDEEDKQFIHEDEVKYIEQFIIDHSKDFIKNFINGEFETLKEEFQEDLISYIEMYKNKLEDCTKFSFNSIEDNCLIELFEEDTIKIISMLNPNLINTLSNFTFQDLDIPRLKELYIEEYKKSKDVVVVLQQNGNINTAKDETARIFNINPEEQLLFKVNSHLSVIRQIKWEELKNENFDFSSIDLTQFYN